MDELKPCPFCGGTNQEPYIHRGGMSPDGYYLAVAMRCQDCGAISPPLFMLYEGDEENLYSAVREKAVESWNRRAKKWMTEKR